MSESGDSPDVNEVDTSASTTNPNATISGSGDTNISGSLTFDEDNSPANTTMSGFDDSQSTGDGSKNIANDSKKITAGNSEDLTIFTRNNEYEDQYLLNENMVNSYTFSEESKSSDGNTDGSVTEEKSTPTATVPKVAEKKPLKTVPNTSNNTEQKKDIPKTTEPGQSNITETTVSVHQVTDENTKSAGHSKDQTAVVDVSKPTVIEQKKIENPLSEYVTNNSSDFNKDNVNKCSDLGDGNDAVKESDEKKNSKENDEKTVIAVKNYIQKNDNENTDIENELITNAPISDDAVNDLQEDDLLNSSCEGLHLELEQSFNEEEILDSDCEKNTIKSSIREAAVDIESEPLSSKDERNELVSEVNKAMENVQMISLENESEDHEKHVDMDVDGFADNAAETKVGQSDVEVAKVEDDISDIDGNKTEMKSTKVDIHQNILESTACLKEISSGNGTKDKPKIDEFKAIMDISVENIEISTSAKNIDDKLESNAGTDKNKLGMETENQATDDEIACTSKDFQSQLAEQVPGLTQVPEKSSEETLTELDMSDELPMMEDNLGLLAEAKTKPRDDEDEEDDYDEDDDHDDDQDDDESSNQMAHDSSEVESNAANNEEPCESDEHTDQIGHSEDDIDQSHDAHDDNDQSYDGIDQSNDGMHQTEEIEMDQSLAALAVGVVEDEGNFELGFMIESVTGSREEGKGEHGTEIAAVGEENGKDAQIETVLTTSVPDKVSPVKVAAPRDPPPPRDTAAPATDATEAMDVDVLMDAVEPAKVTDVTAAVTVAAASELAAVRDDVTDIGKVTDEVAGGKDDEESAKKIVAEPPTAEELPARPAEPPVTPSKDPSKACHEPPSKTKKLEIAKPGNVMNIVELEESSSDSDVQEVGKKPVNAALGRARAPCEPSTPEQTTTVNIPKEIDIMSNSCGDTSKIITTEEENVISGLPKPVPPKKAAPRINTSEITIKTHPKTPEPPTITIPEESETKPRKMKEGSSGLEVFNLDSDDDDCKIEERCGPARKRLSAIELDKKARNRKKCVNYMCESEEGVRYLPAPPFLLSYYEVKRSKRTEQQVCQPCYESVSTRMADLMEGVRQKRPLMELKMDKQSQDFVEISDSESESDGEELDSGIGEKLSPENILFLEENLGPLINDVWSKYGLSEQLKSCEQELQVQLAKIEEDSLEVSSMLNECQDTTDKIRNEFYMTFASEIKELQPLEIFDAPYPEPPMESPYDDGPLSSDTSDAEGRRSKRLRKVVNYEENSLASRSPIPLGYSHLGGQPGAHTTTFLPQQPTARDSDTSATIDERCAFKMAQANDDNADVSVVRQTLELAPADLPAPGALLRPQLQPGDTVYAMRASTFGSWGLARVLEVQPKGTTQPNGLQSLFTTCKIRFEHKLKGAPIKQLTGRQLAFPTPAGVRLTIGARVIAVFKDATNLLKRDSYFSGIIAELPNPVNTYRYLIFFDDGYAQYVPHSCTLVICETSARVWDDVHPDSRDFVRKYLLTYPERPMVRLQPGQALKTEWNGKWWVSRVIRVDASLVQVIFDSDGRMEWIYRGSTRLAPMYLELQAAERHRPRGLHRINKQPASQANMPYVEYTRSDELENKLEVVPQQTVPILPLQQPSAEESRRQQQQMQRAKKSSAAPQPYPQPPQPPQQHIDNVMSRVVYYSPKAAVKPHKMSPHSCGPQCHRTDVYPLKELTKYNPLARPLLTGWERQIVRSRGKKLVMYRAPCGRRLRDMPELHQYLRRTRSEMSVDLFDFNPVTHCLAEFVLNKCYVSKKDLSLGKENMAVPCVNYYDGSLPEFCLYNTERTPTAGVPLNLDPDFLCGCDCTDDCQDKSKCACWKLTLDGARTIGLEGPDVGYQYKRLQEPLSTGIYECNARCKCAKTCLNRVAQHPLQLKLQVFKTLNRGWGIRALNDVPKGGFLCVYAGNLLTDATANLDGVNEGDEYLAELDYIEVVERMKEGYESDVPGGYKADKKGSDGGKSDDEEDEEEPSDDERRAGGDVDADFTPPEFVYKPTQFNKRLRRRGDKDREVKAEEAGAPKEKGAGEQDESFITISDDEEVREPSRFTAQTGLDEDEYVSKHRSVRSFYGEDEACYIMDAKVQGNIGRYLNHSCTPNVFVQNVFVDTHDPRFPWVAFFALCHVKAGTELTWNYNYDIGSVPDKVMYCKCGAPNCRGRLL